MKYFTTKKIGKYEIITGVGKAPIDPELTKKKIEPILKESDEWNILFELGQEKFKMLKEVLNAKSPRYEQLRKMLYNLELEIISADKAFLEKRQKLYQQNAVYSQPANGIMVDSTDKLYIYGEFSNRGDSLVTSDGVHVSKEDVEKSQISCMSEDEKQNRKQHDLTKALSASVQMKNELEVTGDPDAVKKSMDYYNEQKEKIDRKYGG